MRRPALAAALTLLLSAAALGQEVRGHIDWQAHGAMHIPWKIYGDGLVERTPRRTWKHQLKQTFYAPYLRRSGVRLIMSAAMAAEKAKSKGQARKLIIEQLRYVEDFVRRDPEHFALAKTPEEARRILLTTDKIVIVHAIEGAHLLLEGPEDARYWSRRGVALMTLIHLRDDELGGAALNNGLAGKLVNMKGFWRKTFKPKKRGLTDQGKQAIRWLADAGILVDLTHMSPDSIRNTLDVTRRHGIPPIVTHGKFAPVRKSERSFTGAQLVDIYRQGGYFAIPLNGGALDPKKPSVDLPDSFRKKTQDSFQLHMESLQSHLYANASQILGRQVHRPCELTCAERTRLSVGWASDWNGFTNHTKPRHTKREVRRGETRDGLPLPTRLLDIDVVGLAHPGLLPQYWQRLEESGLDLDPMERSLERFLQIWANARGAMGR